MTRASTLGWRELLAARDVPPVLRRAARVARMSGIVFVAAFAAWLVAVCSVGADRQAQAIISAISMGLVGAVHTISVTTMRVRAARVVAARGCLGCGHTLAQGDQASPFEPPRSTVCPECGRADQGVPTSPAVRDVWPGARVRIAEVDTSLARIVVGAAILAGLFAVLSVLAPLLAPVLGVSMSDEVRLGSSRLQLGLIMLVFNASPVYRTLATMRAARQDSAFRQVH